MKTIQTTYCKRFGNSCYHHQCIANYLAGFMTSMTSSVCSDWPQTYYFLPTNGAKKYNNKIKTKYLHQNCNRHTADDYVWCCWRRCFLPTYNSFLCWFYLKKQGENGRESHKSHNTSWACKEFATLAKLIGDLHSYGKKVAQYIVMPSAANIGCFK